MQVLPLVSFQEMIPSQQDEEFPKRGRIRVIGISSLLGQALMVSELKGENWEQRRKKRNYKYR